MSKTSIALLAAAVAGGLTSLAAAQANGSYVFTGDSTGSTNANRVFHLPTGAASPTIVNDFGSSAWLRGIAVGGNNRLFVGNGPFPVMQPVNTTTMMYTVDNWFGMAPTVAPLQNGDPIQLPNQHIFHAPYNGLITVNNPGSQTPLPNRSEGIYHINANTGATTLMFAEPPPGTALPYYNAGGAVTDWDNNADTFFVTAVSGSPTLEPPGGTPGQRASSLHRLDVNPATLAATETLILDLGNTAQTGFSKPIGRANGIANVGDSLFIATFDFEDAVGRVFRADLTPGGTVGSFALVLDNLPFVNDIVYNPYNGKLALSDRSATPGIWEFNPNGTGLTKILDDGTRPDRLAVIPAPSAFALLGLGTLVAARRRR
ncbi:MAG: PEP-CTERM sorting domain-containing protein [Phycisphaerales bacterium]